MRTPLPISPADLALSIDRDLWVFGYGSLMWDPGFPYLEKHRALLRGFHRSFCILSTHYRGTPERPGLVFGLDRGGACRGIAFRVAAADGPGVVAYLWEREMITNVYRPRLVTVRIEAGPVTALAFTVERAHSQYCGRLGVDETAERICRAHGCRGPNRDYLANTVAHLQELGIRDHLLEALLHRVMEKCGVEGNRR